MARITRAFQKIFALSATNNGQFGSAKVGTKVETNDVEELQDLGAYDTGWLDAVITNSAGVPTLPTLEETQSLNYINTYQIAYIFQEGVPEYNALTTYYENSVVKLGGTYELYGSNTDSNIGNTPGIDPEWDLLADLSKVTYTDNSVSVDNEVSLWDGTDGRKLKRATAFTGYPVLTAGVMVTNNAATTFTALKQAASTSATGVVELATDAEAQAASDAARALVPANLAVTVPGIGQTWQNVAGSRVAGTSYQNTTGRPIQLAVISSSSTTYVQASSDNSTWIDIGGGGTDRNTNCNAIIPNNWYYRLQAGGTIAKWAELR